jgi:hypothetical protein
MIDQLSELSEEQLAELQTSIVNEFETVEKEDPTPQTVDAMTSLADMLDTVRGEIKGRAAVAGRRTDGSARRWPVSGPVSTCARRCSNVRAAAEAVMRAARGLLS